MAGVMDIVWLELWFSQGQYEDQVREMTMAMVKPQAKGEGGGKALWLMIPFK
jgi:hypothetical protein